MQSIRSFHPLATSLVTLGLITALGTVADADVGVTINGSPVNVNPAPIIQAGRVFVPLRGVFERLGASVVYDNGEINATGNGRDISLHIGSQNATVDGATETIDVAPFIVGASTYVPLRFVSQTLGATVSWDDADSVVAIQMAGQSQQAFPDDAQPYDNDVSYWADDAPPPMPDYQQPPVPAPNDIWTPGYWAYGAPGYYWVPGTWVAPPQPGYLWTPGYWVADSGRYGFHPGYWAITVGFYGGINYGAGYFGHGYSGGRWSGNTFQYNTAVTHVTNTTIIRNVYVDRTVIVNHDVTVNRVSYAGGAHGVAAAPTPEERHVLSVRHLAMTPAQQQHVQVAAHDPRFAASVNAGKPPVAAVAHPLTQPATQSAAFAPQRPAEHAAPTNMRAEPAYLNPAHEVTPHAAPAPVHHEAAPERPSYAAPAAARPQAAPVRPEAAPAPVHHEAAPPPARPAYAAPARPAAPAGYPYAAPERAPETRTAPQQHAAPPPHAAPAPHEQPGRPAEHTAHPEHTEPPR